jgi:hypothetical protein
MPLSCSSMHRISRAQNIRCVTRFLIWLVESIAKATHFQIQVHCTFAAACHILCRPRHLWQRPASTGIAAESARLPPHRHPTHLQIPNRPPRSRQRLLIITSDPNSQVSNSELILKTSFLNKSEPAQLLSFQKQRELVGFSTRVRQSCPGLPAAVGAPHKPGGGKRSPDPPKPAANTTKNTLPIESLQPNPREKRCTAAHSQGYRSPSSNGELSSFAVLLYLFNTSYAIQPSPKDRRR